MTGTQMVGHFGSPLHDALRRALFHERQRAGLTQTELARRLRWAQRTISDLETGEKRLTVVELIEISEALGFSAAAMVERIARR